MGKVRLLDKHTAELIAAGEVVERPASVVKELVENSIDAHSSVITIEIKSGGVSYIRITDDGDGIAHEDVPTAFLRHATSKISTGEDLARIGTLGFRGEALASVSAVARVELITRTADEETGTHYMIEGGDETDYDECGCARGTTIVVRDLFYNTPARMKFLKKDSAEGNAVASVIDRIALSHPEISFRFIRDGKQTLTTSGDGRLKSAIYAVFGRDFTAGLIPVDYELGNVRVTGYTSKPTETRVNHVMQVFFINGRYCRSKTMQAALEEAYKGSIMVGKHPACVLDLEIDCEAVDVNVHPAKLEVRFTNERPIFEGVYYGVRSALSNNDSRREVKLPEARRPVVDTAPPRPQAVQMPLPIPPTPDPQPQPEPITERQTIHYTPAPQQPDDCVVRDNAISERPPLPDIPPMPYAPAIPRVDINISADSEDDGRDTEPSVFIPEPKEPEAKEPAPAPENIFEQVSQRIVGEVFETYIIIESGDELVLIDKHAAHERLIYERLIAQGGGREPQLLLEPIAITPDRQQYQTLLENRELMMSGGFDIDDFGMGTLLIRSVPTVLCGGDIEGAICEIADNIGVKKNALMTARMEDMYHTIACRSAIKAHDRTLDSEIAALVAELRANPDVRYCPHGRPIYITLKKRELEKNFGRV